MAVAEDTLRQTLDDVAFDWFSRNGNTSGKMGKKQDLNPVSFRNIYSYGFEGTRKRKMKRQIIILFSDRSHS